VYVCAYVVGVRACVRVSVFCVEACTLILGLISNVSAYMTRH